MDKPAWTWTTCLWPGLWQLWHRGEWSGLAAAVFFAAVLDTALVSTLIWPELLGVWLVRAVWSAVAAMWVIGAAVSLGRWRAGETPVAASQAEDLFRGAIDEYLRGDWIGAESLLAQILRADPRDVDAHLMLATVYRRCRRVPEAQHRLRMLSRLSQADKWRLEIEREWKLLEQQVPSGDSATPTDDGPAADESAGKTGSPPVEKPEAA